MSCLITGGNLITCDSNNVGGLSAIYISNYAELATDDIVKGSPAGVINTITMASGKKFYEFQFNPDTTNYIENMVKVVEAGALFYDQVVTLKLPLREYAKCQILSVMANGKFRVIAKDLNGKYWLLGRVNGMFLSKNEGGAGTKKEDGSGYTLELKSIGETSMAMEVDSTIISAIIA